MLPDVHVQAFAVGPLGQAGSAVIDSDAERRMQYVLHNAGGGVAKAVAVVLVAGQQYIAGYIGLGFMQPGASYLIRTEMLPIGFDEGAVGVVVARDVRERSLVWNVRGGKPRHMRRTKRKQAHTLTEMFHAFYPDINLRELEQTTFGTGVAPKAM